MATLPIAPVSLEIPFNWPQKTQKFTKINTVSADSRRRLNVILMVAFFVLFVFFAANMSRLAETDIKLIEECNWVASRFAQTPVTFDSSVAGFFMRDIVGRCEGGLEGR